AAKIFHTCSEIMARKLAAMLKATPAEGAAPPGHLAVAWPEDLLTQHGSRSPVGYIMRRVQHAAPIFCFYNPQSRLRQYPLFHYGYLLQAAANLCAAIGSVHSRGCVVGDINESNILVSSSALVSLVDTDSFQVSDGVQVFRCPVGKEEYTPPELQGCNFNESDRGRHHDLFGLSVLLFQLLMEGAHPFSGSYTGAGDPPSYGQRIRWGHFPHSDRITPYRWPALAPPMGLLYPSLRNLFVRCFVEGHAQPLARPAVVEWQEAICQAAGNLGSCSKNEQHLFGNHLNECPWCARSARLQGRDPFPSRGAIAAGEHLALRSHRSSSGDRLRRTTSRRPVSALAPGAAAPAADNQWGWASILVAILALFKHLNLILGPISIGLGLAGVLLARRSPVTTKGPAWIGIGCGALSTALGAAALFARLGAPASLVSLSVPGPVRSLAFSPETGVLAAGAGADEANRKGGQLELWDGNRQSSFRPMPGLYNGDVLCVRFSPDGRTLAAASAGPFDPGLVTLWSLQTGLPQLTLPQPITGVDTIAFSPNGRRLAAGGSHGVVLEWSLDQPGSPRELHANDQVFALSYSPDGNYLAAACGASRGGAGTGEVLVWSAVAGKRLWAAQAHSTAVLAVSFSPDSATLATAGNDNTVREWSSATGRPTRTLDVGGFWTDCVIYSKDGWLMLVGGDTGVLAMRDAVTGHIDHILYRDTAPILAAALSPHGDLAAGGDEYGVVQVSTQAAAARQ
ncbi:MAG TPA: hypothetical protein VGS41_18630, partial [Chthonomonadales bacterium]|nr:hypothetical protein [Chthonomonadales bacterium]